VREIDIPELSLVVLIGASGCGKSTFAAAHFARTEVISSDFCRGLVADDENDQSASGDAFDLLHFIASKRLAAGRLTVIDATNVQSESRKELIRLAREHDVLPVAIVLDLPEQVCASRNAARPDRQFGPHVIRRQRDQLRRSLRGLEREGFRRVHVLRSQAEVDAALITRTRLFNDLRDQAGPFDVIGDVVETARIAAESKNTGVIYFGGGTPKNFVQQTEVTAIIMNTGVTGHKYAMQVVTDAPHWGGLSGCTFEEAQSWGKIKKDASMVSCHCDSTIAMPILVSALLEQKQLLKRRRCPKFTMGRELGIKA